MRLLGGLGLLYVCVIVLFCFVFMLWFVCLLDCVVVIWLVFWCLRVFGVWLVAIWWFGLTYCALLFALFNVLLNLMLRVVYGGLLYVVVCCLLARLFDLGCVFGLWWGLV